MASALRQRTCSPAKYSRGLKVYAINPRQLDRFRDRFSPAGAKDDSRDAETLSSSLRTDRRAFHEVSLASPAIIELRECSRMADDLSADKIRHANRLREQLQRYYLPRCSNSTPTLPKNGF